MKKAMYLILVLLCMRCAEVVPEYKNKEVYNIAIGETIDIYHVTNSCCRICVANLDSLQYTSQIDDSIIYKDGDCAGCSYTVAISIMGIQAGSDTLRFTNQSGGSACGQEVYHSYLYIVNVEDEKTN